MIDDEGRPKLTDFGLATLVARRADDPSAGTPNYMPPEQAAEWLARPGRASAPSTTGEEPPDRRDFYSRGDVYSLGAVFYEMLTGKPPIPSQGHPEATLRAVGEGKIEPPRQANPAVPPKLDAICRKCLHFDPAQRYGSAAEVATELREYLRPRSRSLSILRGVILLLCITLVGAFVYPPIVRHLEVQRLLDEAKTKAGEALRLESGSGNRENDESRKELLTQAREALSKVINEFDSREPDHHLRFAQLTIDLGKAEEDLRNVPEALRRYRSAEDQLTSKLLGGSDLAMPLLAEVYHLEATLLRDVEKDFINAEKNYLKSRELLTRLHKSNKSRRDHRRNLARSYGYLGDIEVEKGEMGEARRSYDEAKRLRQKLVDLPNPDKTDQYQRARSLGNDGTYLEWEGKFEEAIKVYLYQQGQLKACPTPIPREFQSDPPAVIVQIAELRLLLGRDLDPAKLLESLAEAKKDWEVEPGLKPRILLALGRCNTRLKRKGEAATNLRAAIAEYMDLVHKSKAQPDDYFRLSQAHAAMGRVSDDPKRAEHHRVAAVLRLQEAAGRGFRHWRRVEKDLVFEKAIREREEFQEAIQSMKEKHREVTPPAP